MRSNRGKISPPQTWALILYKWHINAKESKRIQKNAKKNLEKEGKMTKLSVCPFLLPQKADAQCF